MERQPPAAQEGAEPTAGSAEEAAEGAVATEAQEEAHAEAVAVEAQEEAPAEAGLVDIASILGARDSSPVKPVSVESSRVVLDVVVELD
jgi:hypothetical protein